MGTGFSHDLECLFSYAKRDIGGFDSGSSLLLACADERPNGDSPFLLLVV
jgi:hypothetical protein